MLQTILRNLTVLKSDSTELPASLTIINDKYYADSLKENHEVFTTYHGNIGENNINVSIELPNIYVTNNGKYTKDKYSLCSTNLKALGELISSGATDKIISRQYLFDKFKIIKIDYNDLSAYSPNGYSFTPLLFNAGQKIPSVYVGILRIISTGYTYLLLDINGLSANFNYKSDGQFDCIIEPVFLNSYLTTNSTYEFTLNEYKTSIYNKNPNTIIQISDVGDSEYEYINDPIVNKSCVLYMTYNNKYYPINSKYYNVIADVATDIDSAENGTFTVLSERKYSDYIDRYNFLLRLSKSKLDIDNSDTEAEVIPYNYIRLLNNNNYTLTIIDKRLLPTSEILQVSDSTITPSFKIFSPEDVSVYKLTGEYLHPFVDYTFEKNNDNTLKIVGLSNGIYEIVPDHTNELHYLGTYNCKTIEFTFTNKDINKTLHDAELLGCRIDFTKYRIPVYIDGKLSVPEINENDNKLSYNANYKFTFNYIFNTDLNTLDSDINVADNSNNLNNVAVPVYNNIDISNNEHSIKQDYALNYNETSAESIVLQSYAAYTGTGTDADNDSIGIDEIYTVPITYTINDSTKLGHGLFAKTSDTEATSTVVKQLQTDIESAATNYNTEIANLRTNNTNYDNVISRINTKFANAKNLYSALLKFAIKTKTNPINKTLTDSNDKKLLAEISNDDIKYINENNINENTSIYKYNITANDHLAILLESTNDCTNDYFVYFRPNINTDSEYTSLPFKITPYKDDKYIYILYPYNASGTLYYYTDKDVNVYEIL